MCEALTGRERLEQRNRVIGTRAGYQLSHYTTCTVFISAELHYCWRTSVFSVYGLLLYLFNYSSIWLKQ